MLSSLQWKEILTALTPFSLATSLLSAFLLASLVISFTRDAYLTTNMNIRVSYSRAVGNWGGE